MGVVEYAGSNRGEVGQKGVVGENWKVVSNGYKAEPGFTKIICQFFTKKCEKITS